MLPSKSILIGEQDEINNTTICKKRKLAYSTKLLELTWWTSRHLELGQERHRVIQMRDSFSAIVFNVDSLIG